jgi:hypothetical protein
MSQEGRYPQLSLTGSFGRDSSLVELADYLSSCPPATVFSLEHASTSTARFLPAVSFGAKDCQSPT